MAEIRSTLDLVMERTRNLKLSEAERRAQQAEDAQKALNGAVQQYLDHILDMDGLTARVDDIRNGHGLDVDSLLVGVILDKIDLEGLQGPLPELLARCCGKDISGLQDLSREYQRQLTNGRDLRLADLRKELAQRYGIGGAAVVPNLEVDPQWQAEIRRRLAALEEKLSHAKSALRG